jgi:DNA-binding transcriptional LysR family regulator
MQTTDMLSLQPAALVDKYVKKGLLAAIPVALPDRMPDYGLITRLNEVPTPAAQAFIAVLRDQAGAGHAAG